MISKRLKLLVIDEATKLKKFATEYELENVNTWNLDSESRDNCIYGQLTGNCFSKRALELIRKCTIPYSDTITYKTKPIKGFTNETTNRSWSPIEYYIIEKHAKIDILIDYLNGTINTIKL